MDFSIFKVFRIFGAVSTWSAQALADGKISIAEAVSLAVIIAGILGIQTEIEVPVSAPKIDDKDYVPVDVDVHVNGAFSEAAGKPPED